MKTTFSIFAVVWIAQAAATPRPLMFEQNTGQAPAEVRMLARTGRLQVLLTSSETIFQTAYGPRVRMKLAQSGASVVEPYGEALGKANYFLGSNPSRWHSSRLYAAAIRRNASEGIDIVYRGVEGKLEFDLVLHPGADPRRLLLSFHGGQSLRLTGQGDLIVPAEQSEITLRRPATYQETESGTSLVASRFVLRGANSAAIEVGDYDRSQKLVVDPVVFATYLGGTGVETAQSVASDAEGNIYVAGTTTSVDFPEARLLGSSLNLPISLPVADAYVAKMSGDGSRLIWATYLGGVHAEDFVSVGVDRTGAVTVAGLTSSFDFPVTPGAYQFGSRTFRHYFLTRLTPDGSSLMWSTVLGIPVPVYVDPRTVKPSLAVTPSGAATLAVTTPEENLPTSIGALQKQPAGGTDLYVIRLNSTGTAPIFATYFGGSGDDGVAGIAVDAEENILLSGTSWGLDFPMLPAQPSPDPRAFVAKMGATGTSLAFIAALPAATSWARTLGVDAAGNPYITGGVPAAGELRPFPGLNIPDYVIGGQFLAKFYGSTGGLAYAGLIGPGPHLDSTLVVIPDGRACSYSIDIPFFCLSPAGDSVTYAGGARERAEWKTGTPLPDGSIVLASVAATQDQATPGAFQPKPADSSPDAVIARIVPVSTPIVLTNLIPSSIALTTPSIPSSIGITLKGRGFGSDTEVRWNGTPVEAHYNASDSSIDIDVRRVGPLKPGIVEITAVRNDFPNVVSNPLRLTILSTAPAVWVLSPIFIPAGSTGQSVTLQGRFTAETRLLWDGKERDARLIPGSSPAFEIQLTTSELAQPGIHTIQLYTPEPGGGYSPVHFFPVTAPEISSIPILAPGQLLPAGQGEGAAVTITGAGFTPQSEVLWNDVALATTLVNSTTLRVVPPEGMRGPRIVSLRIRSGSYTTPATWASLAATWRDGRSQPTSVYDAWRNRLYVQWRLPSPQDPDAGILSAIDMANGSTAWERPVRSGEPAMAMTLSESGDALYVSSPGTVLRFNPETGEPDGDFNRAVAELGLPQYIPPEIRTIPGAPDSIVLIVSGYALILDGGRLRGPDSRWLPGTVNIGYPLLVTSDAIHIGPFSSGSQTRHGATVSFNSLGFSDARLREFGPETLPALLDFGLFRLLTDGSQVELVGPEALNFCVFDVDLEVRQYSAINGNLLQRRSLDSHQVLSALNLGGSSNRCTVAGPDQMVVVGSNAVWVMPRRP